MLGEAQPIQLMSKEDESGDTTEPEPTPSPNEDPYVAHLKKEALRAVKFKRCLDHRAQLELFLVE